MATRMTGVSLPLDWAQAFAQKRSILIAGTGYQYGDTDFLEYSERLYRDFARELRAGAAGTRDLGRRGAGPGQGDLPRDDAGHPWHPREGHPRGDPLRPADVRRDDAGRPWRDARARADRSTPTEVTPEPAASLGLATADLDASRPALTAEHRLLKNPPYDAIPGTFTDAKWLSGPNGVVTNPAEPALPLVARNATATDGDLVLRGVGFRGGTYVDTASDRPAHRRTDHGAARRPRAVRLARVLPDAPLEPELLRRPG